KSRTLIMGPFDTHTIGTGFGGLCETNGLGDGIVLFDPIADRWFISQLGVACSFFGCNPPFMHCMAVSQTNDPTGAWNRYAFTTNGFPDYPKVGVWPDAYYVSYNTFDNSLTSFQGAQLCATDRASMLTG